jgi:hypothetical protein
MPEIFFEYSSFFFFLHLTIRCNPYYSTVTIDYPSIMYGLYQAVNTVPYRTVLKSECSKITRQKTIITDNLLRCIGTDQSKGPLNNFVLHKKGIIVDVGVTQHKREQVREQEHLHQVGSDVPQLLSLKLNG